MSIKRSKSLALFVGTALSATRSLAAQCNETEALLRVSFTIDEDGWDDLYPLNYTGYRLSPELIVRPSGNIGNSTVDVRSFVEYGSFDDLVDFETCIPREGACVELTVSILPPNAYNISWNGQSVKVGQEFTMSLLSIPQAITTTEIGDFCTPVCDEDSEALFDYQYWKNMWSSVDAFRVEDQSGNMVLGCDSQDGNCGRWESGASFSMYRYRDCLPKDTCYVFLTGNSYGFISNADHPILSLQYDGEVVEKRDNWRFISSAFGSNCVPDCKTDSESVVEFFMYRSSDIYCGSSRSDLDYSWDLSVENIDGSSSSDSNGTIHHCPNTTLFHELMCIPKSSCASFHIESLNDTFTTPSAYSLKMDGTSYRSSHSYNGWNQTTNIGSCSVGDLCDPSNQALFELELHTPTEYTLQNGESSSVINSYDIEWILANDGLGRSISSNEALHSSLEYNDALYELGAVYRTIECVPNGECEYDFNITSSSPVETYTVKRNGVELSRIIVQLPADEWHGVGYGPVEVTTFGDSCVPGESKKLSGGAIAGIVIVCLVVAGAIMGFGYMWYKKHKEVHPMEQDPLTEDLLSTTL